MRKFAWLTIFLILFGGALYLFLQWPLRDPHPAPQPVHGVLAIRDVKIYPSPDDPPIEHGTILVRDGVITTLGSDVAVPADAQVLSCRGCVVTAGLWNTHVHFTEPKWEWAAWKSANTLNAQLNDMLTSRGFTTVVDASSDPRITISLRRRVESGELLGPFIYTAGAALLPPNGVPYYIRDKAPFYVLWMMPQPSTREQAARDVEANMARGADLLKLFTGSYVKRGEVLPMPVPVAQAAVEVAHRHGQIAYAHESNLAGAKVAIESGVDVLAHAPDSTEGIDRALLRNIAERHMTMIPTLSMFAETVTTKPAYIDPIHAIVREFHALDGNLMFGTDVGYLTDYDTTAEYGALLDCGLNFRDILRMLTVAPAARFGVAGRKGTVSVGKVADLVVLDRDPGREITAFAHPRYTIRSGRILYGR